MKIKPSSEVMSRRQQRGLEAALCVCVGGDEDRYSDIGPGFTQSCQWVVASEGSVTWGTGNNPKETKSLGDLAHAV